MNILKQTCLATALLASSQLLLAEDLYFSLLNDATASITSFQTSPVSQSSWGSNLMAGYELPPNGEVEVAIEDGVGVCEYDILVTFEDGSTVDDRNVNLCDLGSYSVHD